MKQRNIIQIAPKHLQVKGLSRLANEKEIRKITQKRKLNKIET